MQVRSGFTFAEAAIPSPPWSAAPKSVMMSPNMLLVTMTWKDEGFFTSIGAHGVDVHVLRCDRRVAAGYFLKGALPKVAAEAQRIALVRHGDFVGLVTCGEGKRGLKNSLNPFSGRDAFLY